MGRNDRGVARFLGVMAALSWIACASAPNASTSGAAATEEASFNARTVDSFSPLDGTFVCVRLTGGEQYLLTLDSLYSSLPFAIGIKLAGTFSRVCSVSGTMITLTDSGLAKYCRIIRFETVTSEDHARDLVRARTPPRSGE